MELFTVVVVTVLLVNIVLFLGIKSDWKDLTRERDRLREAWSDYYAESRKYNQIKSVDIEYSGGGIEVITGVKSYNTSSKDGLVHFYNENGVALKLIKIENIKSIKFNRADNYTAGERNILDDI